MPKSASSARADLEVFDRFCSALTLEQGEAFQLEPFERVMLADYFAGTRETLILLPKKNGKSTTIAALALFHLIVTRDAECVIGAASRDQATIVYDAAVGFVRRSEGLQDRLVAKRGYREIRSQRTAGRVRVLAADVDTADGVTPTLALVDELHRHKSAGLYGVFRDGLGPRDGQMVTISTAGDHEQSPLGLMRQHARQLPRRKLTGRHLYTRSADGAFALHEWSLASDDDVDDMAVVKQANPASWQTVASLQERHDSPSMLPWQWRRFACGQWVSSEAWWIAPDDWHALVDVVRLHDGDEVAIGFDGSRYGDATALVACRLSDALLQVLGVWEHPAGAGDWEVPVSAVDARLAETMERYKVVRGYFDPPLWQTEIDEWAREYGDEVVVRYPTNRGRMMAATERFRTDLIAGKIRHAGDEALTRHVLNAQIRDARGGYWLTKSRRDSPDKIDAAVAAVLAYEARADVLATRRARRPAQLVTF